MTISSSLLLLVGQNSQGGPVRYRGCWMLPYSQASHEHHERRCHGHSPNYDLARSRSRSVTSASVTPWTVARSLLCPWRFPGKNTGVGCHALLQGIFPTQGLNLYLFMSPASAGGFFTTGATWEACQKVHPSIFTVDNQRGPTVEHRELCSILCNNFNGKRIWKNSLKKNRYAIEYNWITPCCTPETNSTL